mmetsp:Transcript_48375/g.35583  ORF Transcript_48375/g.35583 Transcript_48375/m.35583 type:complete len:87 (-) Transcript_48375:1725-1985(-)
MKKVVPKPQMLPIRLSVVIQSKSIFRFENIHLKQYESMQDLMKIVEDIQAKKGDPISNWNIPSLSFLITGPLFDPVYMMEEEQQKQ